MTSGQCQWRCMLIVAIASLSMIAESALGQQREHVLLHGIERASINETYKVLARQLNFRPEPTLETRPISVIERDDFVMKVGETFNSDEGIQWLNVLRSDGRTGWVSANYLRPVKEDLIKLEGAAAFLAALDQKSTPVRVSAKNPIRAGFIYVGPVGDAGWTFQHDLGRLLMEQLPFVESTSYVGPVPEDPELVTAAIDDLVDQGNNLIFATSFGYMDPTIDAAKRYPNVVFMHNSGFKTAPNAGTYFGRIYEARYLTGLVAGAMTETNLIGYIAAFPIPEVIRGINAFTLGAKDVNPSVKVRVLWTNTWYGPGIENEKAEKLLDGGADVLAIHQDSPAAIQAAEQRGKYAIGYHSDMSVFGPQATLTSAVWDWSVIYEQIAHNLSKGTWEAKQLWWGLDRGLVNIATLSDNVPADIRNLVEERRQKIANGELHVFVGPIQDTSRRIVVPFGRVLSDAELLTMDYYVLGVEGGVSP